MRRVNAARRRSGSRVARSTTRALVAALLAAAVTAPAGAIEYVVAAGEFDVENPLGDGPYEIGFVVRLLDAELFEVSWAKLVPAFGVMATEDETIYGWGGLVLEIPVGRWRLLPMVGAGFYDKGDGRDLGGTFEFRSGLEVAVRPSERTSVGLEFYHLSNAGFHELNPGSNSIVVNFGFTP